MNFVLDVVADPKVALETRLGAASIALPFLYPKLSATTVNATHLTVRATESNEDARLRLLDRLNRLAPPGNERAADIPSAMGFGKTHAE